MLWALYSSHLKRYPEFLRNDPEMIYPGIRDSLEISGSDTQFRAGDVLYKLIYKELPSETEHWGSRSDRTTKTRATIALEVDGACAFEFAMTKSVTDTPEMPIFHETMGEIAAFIEGPWVAEISNLSQGIKLHQKEVWEKRQAPKKLQKLQEDMKKFGL